jgi:hypothetical protein
LPADDERLARGGEAGSRDKIVQRLHGVAGAERAGTDQPRAKHRQNGAGAIDRRIVAADHEHQRRLQRALARAGDGSIDHGHATAGQHRAELSRARRLGGGGVDHEAAGAQRGQQARRPALGQHLTHDLAGRQHGDEDIGGRQFARIGERSAAEFRGETCACRGVAIPRQHRIATAHQMPRHWEAHVAKPDEADRLIHRRRRQSPRITVFEIAAPSRNAISLRYASEFQNASAAARLGNS